MSKYLSVLVSAGHSDSDPGAIGHGLREADLTLALRDAVAKILRTKIERVLTDGPENVNKPLSYAMGLERDASIRVEFHYNVGPAKAEGVEALSLPANKELAQALAQAVAQTTGSPLRGDKGWKDQATAGPHSRLGFCIRGGVILEVEFISNKSRIETYVAKKAEVAQAITDTLELWARKGK